MAASRARQEDRDSAGCGSAVAVCLLVGLAIVYWYIVLGILGVLAVAAAVAFIRRRKSARRRPGPADPWLNEVVVAAAELGFREHARSRHRSLGGVGAVGDVELRGRRLDVDVAIFISGGDVHDAEIGLRVDERTRQALRNGDRALAIRDRVLFVANGRGPVVDEALLDELERTVERLPRQVAAVRQLPARTGGFAPTAADDAGGRTDAFADLDRLVALHTRGVLTDAEFAETKAELLRRL